MKKVFQTRFLGSDAPQEKQGDCFQACLASIFEIPLDEAFDMLEYDEGHWFDEFNKWLAKWNLACVYISGTDDKPIPATEFLGYHIGDRESTTLPNPEDGHVIVLLDDKLVFDPNPNSKVIGKSKGIFLFVCRDPSKQVPETLEAGAALQIQGK